MRLTARSLARVGVWVVIVGLLIVLVMVLLCGPASALTLHGAQQAPGTSPDDLATVVNNATRWLVGISATIATFFFTLGGVKYLGAGGDPSEVERAKGSLKNAGIGYAIAVLAPVLLKIAQSILGVQ